MKKFKSIILTLIVAVIASNAMGQANPTIAVLPANSGQVGVGGILDLQITIGNTGTANIVAFKLRPVITVPGIVTFLPDAQQTAGLPAGWSIVSNTGAQLRICNGTDVIPGSGNRTIILKVQGVTIGGPTTFSGQLNFGGASCAAGGSAPTGNVTADDNATSTIEVITIVPLTLTDFTASLKDCKPVLKWTTEAEINTDRFEIERSNGSNATDWKAIGTLTANGNSSSKINYAFTDDDANLTSEKVFYRLKMIDKNGSFTYSKTLPVLRNCKTANISVYPNPVQDGKLYISLAGTIGNTEASLISTSGQVILKSKMSNGTNYLNVANVAEGIYIVNVKDANGFDKNTKVSIRH